MIYSGWQVKNATAVSDSFDTLEILRDRAARLLQTFRIETHQNRHPDSGH
jgi:hypothetical protein